MASINLNEFPRVNSDNYISMNKRSGKFIRSEGKTSIGSNINLYDFDDTKNVCDLKKVSSLKKSRLGRMS